MKENSMDSYYAIINSYQVVNWIHLIRWLRTECKEIQKYCHLLKKEKKT